MNITESAYKQIIREYDEKQLRAVSDSRRKKQLLEEKLPRLREIEGEKASLYVKKASCNIKGGSFDYREKLKTLKAEEQTLLKSAGLTEADLSPRYECPICQDTGYADGKMCRCFKDRITDILYDQSNIREILKTENFDNFSLEYYSDAPISEGSSLTERLLAQRAENAAYSFINNFDSSDENLLISGNCGTGKTFLSNCIAKEIIEKGCFVVYLSAIKLFDILSDAAFDREDSSFGLSKHIYECDLLIIDDLGTELVNSFTSARLFSCINDRLLGRKHTIISTNLSAHQLQEKYSERIFSRITNRYTLIKLLGSDIRMKKRLEN